jgi:hypothetical protein
MPRTERACLNDHHGAPDCVLANLPPDKWCAACADRFHLERAHLPEEMRGISLTVLESNFACPCGAQQRIRPDPAKLATLYRCRCGAEWFFTLHTHFAEGCAQALVSVSRWTAHPDAFALVNGEEPV